MLINKNKKKKGNKKGFSLVELIVVIAILAIMVAVLAPSLLAYVERSRAQRDDSAMGEVANAIQLAMADQKVFDEVLYNSCCGNVSCYIDATAESAVASSDHVGGAVTKTVTKASNGTWVDQYLFGDNARLADETPYHFAGNMRGMTITFQPEKSSNTSTMKLYDAIINKALRSNGATATTDVRQDTNLIAGGRAADPVTYINDVPSYDSVGNLGNMTSGSAGGNTYLYNRVRATVGDEIKLTSQTYRNSEYTVFIRMGSTGGNQASAQDAIVIYGQWNGTNLVAKNGGNNNNEPGTSEYTRSDEHAGAYIERAYTYGLPVYDDGVITEAIISVFINAEGGLEYSVTHGGQVLEYASFNKEELVIEGNNITIPNVPGNDNVITFIVSNDGSSIKIPSDYDENGNVISHFELTVDLNS